MQNGEQPIRLPNSLLYPRVEVEQRTHSGDEIEFAVHGYCNVNLVCSGPKKSSLHFVLQANTNTLALAASHEIVELDVSGITDADNSSTRGWNDKPRKT